MVDCWVRGAQLASGGLAAAQECYRILICFVCAFHRCDTKSMVFCTVEYFTAPKLKMVIKLFGYLFKII